MWWISFEAFDVVLDTGTHGIFRTYVTRLTVGNAHRSALYGEEFDYQTRGPAAALRFSRRQVFPVGGRLGERAPRRTMSLLLHQLHYQTHTFKLR